MIEYVESGEFLVDEKAMKRKLAADRKKLWKHRANVVWKEFKWDIAAIVYASIASRVIYIFTRPFFNQTLDAIAVSILGFIVGMFIHMVYEEFLKHRIDRVLASWSGQDLGRGRNNE